MGFKNLPPTCGQRVAFQRGVDASEADGVLINKYLRKFIPKVD
jgi:hypothetical protein